MAKPVVVSDVGAISEIIDVEGEISCGVSFKAGDAESLTRAAHTLKSSAGFFGASELVATALTVENLGKAADIEEARRQLPTLEAHTARLTAALNAKHPPPGGQT